MQVAESWSPDEIMSGNQNSNVRWSPNNKDLNSTKGAIVAQLQELVASLNPGSNYPHA